MTDAPVLSPTTDAPMRFGVAPGSGARALRLVGELDLSGVDRLLAAFGELEGSGDGVLDLTDLTFMDSSGIHACFRISLELAETGARLVLCNPQRMVQRVIEIAGLLDVPNIIER